MPSRLIYLNRWPADLPFIVLTPQLKPDPSDPEIQWSAEYIDEVVRYVTANFSVDLSRIYVTGISRGGTGAWTYASAYSHKIAALLPMSGRSDLSQACPIKDIPIWAFHGDGDGVAPPEYSINMVNAVGDCQPSGIYKPRLNILHARNHNGWNEVYNGTSGYRVYDWLLMFRKNDISNKKPHVNAGIDLRIQLRNQPLHLIGDFFDSDGKTMAVKWKQINGIALTLNNTESRYLEISDLRTGTFEFELTVIDDQGAQSSDKVSLEITDTSISPSMTELVLIDGKKNNVIGNLSEGQVINMSLLGISEINIQALVTDATASVRFRVNTDGNTRTQNSPGPYYIKTQTTYPEWIINNGEYLICATPYPQTNARGNPGVSQCYKVTVTDGENTEGCAGSGTIRQEVWTGISGTLISSIPQDSEPSSVNDLSIFEGGTNIGDNYGSRIRGYICAPASGNYTFWISGNDRTELWLSTDDSPANKRMIASAGGYTNARQWTKYASQQSSAISLVANQKYYIEALHKEGTGSDHVAVGWELPGGTLERPIPGMRLIPFGSSGSSTTPVVSITSPDDGETFSAPASVSIAANASISEGSISKVEFHNGSSKLGEDATSPYTFSWNNVPVGNYTITAKAIDNTGASASASVDITVSDGSSCAGTGTIQREVWTGVSGADVGSIPVNSPPDGSTELTIFEDLTNAGDNYGTRVSGYLCVPASGAYNFWISSNDHSELWLSTDSDPGNKRRIAYVTGYTNSRQWTRFTTQQSSPVNLIAGQQYYIEALHKEGVGSDHMAVGWQLPDGTFERPIPGNRLSPTGSQAMTGFGETTMAMEADNTMMSQADENDESALQVFPNPAPGGESELTISGYEGVNETRETKIEILRMTGELVYSESVLCESNCDGYSIAVNKELPTGVYLVNVVTNGQRHSKRLLIK
ncbi:MAG: Ig-like domain-containing protein [Cyclobacteriaceae bacterium]